MTTTHTRGARKHWMWILGAILVVLVTGVVVAVRSGSSLTVPDSPFFAYSDTNASRDLAAAKADDSREAPQIELLATTPTAVWFAGGDDAAAAQSDAFDRAESVTTAAAQAGKIPVLVLYDIPGRDCGSFSAGGSTDAEEYYAYVGALGAGIGDRQAWIIIEPDAIAHAIVDCPSIDPATRYEQISTAIDILAKQPNVKLYLDGGNADWVKDTAALASALKQSGLDRTDGFALNVSNFQTTAASVGYGKTVSEAAGGAHFVVDTSRNGNGPDGSQWCNPPGRAIGDFPTTATADDLVDAYLWIKIPGDSDGTCNGGPAAGSWWRDYAVGLVDNR